MALGANYRPEATRSSKYSLTPLSQIFRKKGRKERVEKANVGLPGQGKIEGMNIS